MKVKKKKNNYFYLLYAFMHFLEIVFIILCFQYIFSSYIDNNFIERGIPVLVCISYYIVYAIINYIFYQIKKIKEVKDINNASEKL